MNREFKPSSSLIRTVFAAAAVLATVLVAGSIEGLIHHYSPDTQLASAHHIVVAKR